MVGHKTGRHEAGVPLCASWGEPCAALDMTGTDSTRLWENTHFLWSQEAKEICFEKLSLRHHYCAGQASRLICPAIAALNLACLYSAHISTWERLSEAWTAHVKTSRQGFLGSLMLDNPGHVVSPSEEGNFLPVSILALQP